MRTTTHFYNAVTVFDKNMIRVDHFPVEFQVLELFKYLTHNILRTTNGRIKYIQSIILRHLLIRNKTLANKGKVYVASTSTCKKNLRKQS